MKNLFAIIRAFAASIRGVNAPLQMIKGGGGALENARIKSRFASVFSGILFAIVGGLAASVADSANAQEAEMSVFVRTSGAITITRGASSATVDVSQSYLSIYADIPAVYSNFVFERVNGDGTRDATSIGNVASGGLEFTPLLVGGSTLVLYDGDARRREDGGFLFGSPMEVLSAILYVDSAGVTAFATVSGRDSALADDEFFLDSAFRETRIPATTNIGYEMPPTCTGADITVGGLRCEMPPEMETENGGGVVVSKDERDFPVVGAIVMGVLMFGLSQGGEEGEFSYSPSFGYSVNESGYSANIGGRMNFQKDEWSAYWSAGQTNANGNWDNFRYASGGEYKTDFWQAAFSESVQGERADYDLSLSADLTGGIWSLSPVYRMNARLNEGKSVSRNSLNLEGVLKWNRWTIRQSAGFGWRRMENFGDSAKFRLEAVREF